MNPRSCFKRACPNATHIRRRATFDLASMTALVTALAAAAPAFAVIIPPGPNNGIAIQQLDMAFTGISESRSDWGQLNADPLQLAQFTGMPRGFLNVFAPSNGGWVVQNLYLDSSDNLGPITRNFSLGLSSPTPITSLLARIEYTPDPLSAMPAPGGEAFHPVTPEQYNAEGVGDVPTSAVGVPLPGGYYPQLQGITQRFVSLPNRVNVHAAQNQCFSMSIANSLQYLKLSFPGSLPLPNAHVPGLRGDNTLVGRLDTMANRTAPSRMMGGGMWFVPMVQGKFFYLASVGVQNRLAHKHQGVGWGGAGQAMPAGNFTAAGITSVYQGPYPTWQWIRDELMIGADVEITFTYEDANGMPRGGHAVRVFECGMTRGAPWLGYLHDAIQTGQGDPFDAKGLTCQREFTQDVDGDGFMNIGSRFREIRFALAEEIDCNTNGTSDITDVQSGASRDCNSNGLPDACDIARGTAADCNSNGSIDLCELTGRDCNTNQVPDDCDIRAGVLHDANGNGIPDECEPAAACGTCRGDLNGDFFVDAADAQCFLNCLTIGVPLVCPSCACADMNNDQIVNAADLPMFVAKVLYDPNTMCP